jgi:hypothetical protein
MLSLGLANSIQTLGVAEVKARSGKLTMPQRLGQSIVVFGFVFEFCPNNLKSLFSGSQYKVLSSLARLMMF